MRRIIRVAAALLFVAGITVFVYPHIQQHLYKLRAQELILLKTEKYAVMDFGDLYERMREYNLNIYETRQAGLIDPFSYESASLDLSVWGIEDNMMGYIDIPAMDTKLPIYLGATRENMKKGAVHLSNTSLHIGGENTNTVIAAHRGYAYAAMFRNIQKLKIGDELFITNFWETMTYEVTEIAIILPNETDKILIREGKEMLTLITCHPLRNNTRRYVVYCERVRR